MAERQSPIERRIPPVALCLLAAGAMWLLARITPAYRVAVPGRVALALVLAALAVLVGISGVRAFARARTTVNPLQPGEATSLVTQGIYSRTRNPMYLALALVLVGWACWLASPLALLVVAAFVAYLTRYQIRPEERALEATFGEAFREYCARVGRWW
ncbi:MAG TPA: isoprenylcysteine carboxylmethyltransferase family protein [Steroidobacteraceae bacterium]|nr:isoprenylcysteine carboxylmethyltransferase family protein [Steroidobacteraceae bacterium]